jgi:hypothetical protein
MQQFEKDMVDPSTPGHRRRKIAAERLRGQLDLGPV